MYAVVLCRRFDELSEGERIKDGEKAVVDRSLSAARQFNSSQSNSEPLDDATIVETVTASSSNDVSTELLGGRSYVTHGTETGC